MDKSRSSHHLAYYIFHLHKQLEFKTSDGEVSRERTGEGRGKRGEGERRGEGIGEGKIHTSASDSISCVALMAGACSVANGVVAVCVMRTSPMLYDTFIYICGRDKKMTKSSVRKRCYIMKR